MFRHFLKIKKKNVTFDLSILILINRREAQSKCRRIGAFKFHSWTSSVNEQLIKSQNQNFVLNTPRDENAFVKKGASIKKNLSRLTFVIFTTLTFASPTSSKNFNWQSKQRNEKNLHNKRKTPKAD